MSESAHPEKSVHTSEGVIRGILPLIIIRSGGMYAARSIFAEQKDSQEEKTSPLLRSKNTYLADLPPGVRSARKTGQWPVFSENGPVGTGMLATAG